MDTPHLSHTLRKLAPYIFIRPLRPVPNLVFAKTLVGPLCFLDFFRTHNEQVLLCLLTWISHFSGSWLDKIGFIAILRRVTVTFRRKSGTLRFLYLATLLWSNYALAIVRSKWWWKRRTRHDLLQNHIL